MPVPKKKALSRSAPFLSIVIPVYNGAGSVGGVVENALSALSGDFRVQVVLVNDASPDDSHPVCVRLADEHPDSVVYLRLARNSGEHNAVLAGLASCEGDFALIMDDDDQNAPEDVKVMFAAMAERDLDVVFGDYRSKEHPWWRNLGSAFNDRVATWMLGKPADLYLCSFKLINRFAIDRALAYHGPFPYIDGLLLRATSHVGSVLVTHRPRKEGRSSYTLAKLFRLWMAMFTNFSVLPLRVASVVGFLASAAAFVAAGGLVLNHFFAGRDVPGWTSLFVAVIFFAGLQLLSLGLIGEYLGRAFLTLNGAPAYTVREKRGGHAGTRR